MPNNYESQCHQMMSKKVAATASYNHFFKYSKLISSKSNFIKIVNLSVISIFHSLTQTILLNDVVNPALLLINEE